MEIDLHVHSSYSFDSRLEPADIIEVALDKGLDGVAVCDHNTCEGGVATKRLAPPELMVIPGIELGCEVVGDVLGLFVTEQDADEMKRALETREVKDFVRAVKAQNGLLVLPHPGDIGMRYLEAEKLISHFDGVETFNSRRATVSEIPPGDGEEWLADFARRHRLAVTAGSDAHMAGEVGRARTILPANDERAIRKAFADRSTMVVGRRTGLGARFYSQFLRFLGLGGGGGASSKD
ncbi:MAG: PHP domain-containing protein [Planctomycetota bacterium]